MTMTKKRLRSLTIVPDELYVPRHADQQLNRVIDEMGRPGYVLVARQMGKTNLLLHMKRTREALGDVVCYFDLSTRHASLQAFFRAVIDAVGATLAATETMELIQTSRANGLEPNVEFDLHLRMLLEHKQPERLIILLDEIDSLIGVTYSDKVLAQIRSMYFARANHPIYDRLTYVLSGVAEPSDLIKDKNISPFNIGEKIYLENFTLSELSNLLKNGGLFLPPSIIERIYHWTSGNPRMSWDICSVIEDMQIAGERLTPESVDKAVERVYLSNFDRAPVDHIRTLVQADPSLRDALMSIHYGKGDTLDDAIRSRLHLSGITTAPGTKPEIINHIIGAALSTEWLIRVAAGHTSLLDAAKRHYSEHDFSAAVRLFESFVEQEPATGITLNRSQLMQFGISLYHLQRFEDAQERLKAADQATGMPELKASILFYLASSKLKAGDIEESIGLFEQASAEPGEFQSRSKLALSGALIASSARAHSRRIITLSEEILAQNDDPPDERGHEITASAYFNLAQAHLAVKETENGLSALRKALLIAPADLQPRIHLTLIDALSDPVERVTALRHVVEQLEQNLPIARRYGTSTLSFSNFTLGELIAKSLHLGHEDLASRLGQLAQESLNEPSLGRVTVKILGSARSATDHSAVLPLIRASLERVDDDRLQSSDVIVLARANVLASDAVEKSNAFEYYTNFVCAHASAFVFEPEDGLICIGQMAHEASRSGDDKTKDVIAFFDTFINQFVRAYAPFYALYINQKITYYQSINQVDRAQKEAQRLLDLISNPEFADDLKDPSVQTFMKQIHDQALVVLRTSHPDRFRKIGRNQLVRYIDTRTGQQKMSKFKKVETEVRSGLFEIVSPDLEP